MPFSFCRPNTPLYILHKEAIPYLEIGQIVSVSQPRPQFPQNNFMSNLLEVDVTAKVGETTTTFSKIPASAEIADFGVQNNIVLSCSKEAMNTEVTGLREHSEEIIRSIDTHKEIIQACEKILSIVNPEFAERKRLLEENASLRADIEELKKKVNENGISNN